METIVPRRSLYQWCLQERQGILWVLGCAFLGSLFGFGIGSGWLTGEGRNPPSTWRVALGGRIRSSAPYGYFALQGNNNININAPWAPSSSGGSLGASGGMGGGDSRSSPPLSKTGSSHSSNLDPRSQPVVPIDSQVLKSDPSHPTIYAVLREAIVREKGGFVHPDLGILSPSPCGASRGLGMLRDSYNRCQTQCMTGIAKEKLALKAENSNSTTADVDDGDSSTEKNPSYKQEEVLIKVPLKFQMTRAVALETLLPRVSAEAQRKANLHELDDAALLVLLLAHERGFGRYSRWLPYIASLPLEPSCGYSQNLRPYLLDSIQALKDELGLDVNGWPTELQKATQYADRIANGLARDYGAFLQHPKGTSAVDNIQWALCQVASRGTAGSQKHGALRMVPLMDMVNHDAAAGGFVELTGKERLGNGDFVDAMEDDSGAFGVRSLRHGRRKALRPGQELLVNYNVPHYSALDWFVSLGFVPPERWSKWEKMDAALPRIRRDGPFGAGEEQSSSSSSSSTPPSRSNNWHSNSNGEL
jgi:hypothetical protein